MPGKEDRGLILPGMCSNAPCRVDSFLGIPPERRAKLTPSPPLRRVRPSVRVLQKGAFLLRPSFTHSLTLARRRVGAAKDADERTDGRMGGKLARRRRRGFIRSFLVVAPCGCSFRRNVIHGKGREHKTFCLFIAAARMISNSVPHAPTPLRERSPGRASHKF